MNLVGWFFDHLWKKVDPQKHTLPIQLDITNACNLACTHCYHDSHKNSGALTYDQWLQVLDQYELLLKKLRMSPRLTICGGEPLVCPFLIPLLQEIRRRFGRCAIYLLTNGTRIDKDVAQVFRSLCLHVQISIDGPDASRHDSIRGKGSFEKSMCGSSLLKENSVDFHFLAVLSNKTSQWISDFFTLAASMGAAGMCFTRLIVEGYAKKLVSHGMDHPLEGTDLKNAMSEILRCSNEKKVPTAAEGPLWHLFHDAGAIPSGIGFGIIVGYRGDMKVSSRTSLTLGNVFRDGMGKIYLNNPILKKLRGGKIDVCRHCRHFVKCRGDRNASFAKYGHFFGPDPGCWLVPDALMAYEN